MPPKGYRSITVSENIIKRLHEIVSQKGFSSLNDVIAFLIDRYKEYTVIYGKLTDLLSRTEGQKCLDEELFARLERLRVKIGLANVFDVIKFLLDTYEAEEEYLKFRKEMLDRLEKIDRTIREIDEKLKRRRKETEETSSE